MTLHDYLNLAGCSQIPESLPDFEMAFGARDYQISDLHCLLENNRFGLFSDAGVGKSLPMHAFILYHRALKNKALILLPPVLILQFVSDIYSTFIGSEGYLTTQDFTKSKPQRDKLVSEWTGGDCWPGLLLMSPKMFLKYPRLLEACEYDVVIVDEAQSLRGSESKIRGAVYDYTENEHDTILVLSTGTPIHNTPIDLFSLVDLIQRDQWFNLGSFKRRFCIIDHDYISIMKNTRRGPRSVRVKTEKIVGFKNLDRLNEVTYQQASRVTKSQVLSLKDPTIIRRRVKMSHAHYSLYRTMLKTRMLEIEEEGIIFTAELETQLRQHLMQIVVAPQNYVAEGKKIDNQLMEALKTIVDGVKDGEKVVVYSYHNSASDAVAEAFSHLNPAVIYGGLPSNSKEAERFKHDPDCRMLAANPVSGGVGLNLQKVCSTVVVYEPWAVPGDFTQALARVWRSGQENAVVCYLLEAEKTAFPATIDTMLGRNSMAVEANGDPASFVDYMTGE